MRKHHKNMLLDMTSTLSEANAEIKKIYYKDNKPALLALLENCNDFVAQISSYITELDGNEVKTLAHLEEYRVFINDIKSQIDNKEKVLDIIKLLQKKISVIKVSMRNDIKIDRFEIAFMPYKASMFDCMETVWAAASADPQCDAYVVPIPYYVKNQYPHCNSHGEMLCDSDEFPDYIPIVNWQEYSLDDRRPDVIVIHNMYDDVNLVTEVHSDFFTERLKTYTDMLVYIPYFVVGDTTIAKDFVVQKSILYIDKIFVESEKVRNEYISWVEKSWGDFSLNKKMKLKDFKNKIVALGSPKLEKALITKRDDCSLPEEWQRLIGDRKVVLYITSLLLVVKDDGYDKIESVIDTFRNRDDVALWWRPHPLSEATLSALSPYHLQRYIHIVEKYKAAGLGIFDDTADLHRAIAWSDCYYGDMCSAAVVYEVTGKPIFYQDISVPYAFSELGTNFPITMSVYNEKLYYTLPTRNAIFELDTNSDSMKPKFHSMNPNKPVYNIAPYICSFVLNDDLWLVPIFGNEITTYNFENCEYKTRFLDLKEDYKTKGIPNFVNFLIFNEILYLFPLGYNAIVSYNLATSETKHLLNVVDVFPEFLNINNLNKKFFFSYEHLDSTRVILPTTFSNKMLEFNIIDYSYTIHQICDEDIIFYGTVKYNEAIWLVSKYTPVIYKWLYNDNTIEKIDIIPIEFNKKKIKKCLFRHYNVRFENYLYLFPVFSDMVCRVNMDSGEIEEINEFKKYIPAQDNKLKTLVFGETVLINDDIYVCQKEGLIIKYNISNKTVDACDVTKNISKSDYHKLSNDYLDRFLESSSFYKKDKESNDDNLIDVGSEIFNYLRNQILQGG